MGTTGIEGIDMGIARYYQADRNPEGASLPGIPLGDIDDETWARLPQWAKDDVDAWTVNGAKVYRMTHRILPELELLTEDNKPEAIQPEEDIAPSTEDPPSDEAQQPPDGTPPEDVPSDKGGN